AACGALGLTVSLAILYRLQARFGSLYLLAGVGSCLYLTGLFFGNRLGELLLRLTRDRPRLVRSALFVFTLAQAGVALGLLTGTEHVAGAMGLVSFCWGAGVTAGLAMPTALAACEGNRADGAAVFVLADALGAAVAGLFFVLLVPLTGLWETVACFAGLACGMALCAAMGSRHARLTAGLALAATLAVLGGHVRDAWPEHLPVARDNGAMETQTPAMQVTNHSPQAEDKKTMQLRGIPRKVKIERVREQMRDGSLSTHTAEFWNGKYE
ncbi:MAG: hypothetical protein WCK89_15605, partial [bacterium]